MDAIRIRGARTHNLKAVSLELPKNRLVVFTGVSGSGKSSLAFDTLYAEGQRRYVESLSAYARQFLERMDRPDVDLIEGLAPAIAIEQRAGAPNPRSTVGTVTEIHDYLRLLWARAGTPHCPEHGLPLAAQPVAQMVEAVLALPQDTRVLVLAPVLAGRRGEHAALFDELRAQGFARVRIDGELHDLDHAPRLSPRRAHAIEIVVDRLRVRPEARTRLADSLETALRHADGRAIVVEADRGVEHVFSARFACPRCATALPELEPRLFSFNHPHGACPRCGGLGSVEHFDPQRIVAHPELSLAAGAIRGWDRRNALYFAIIESLARHYGFDPTQPWEALEERVQAIVLYGSGEEAIAFRLPAAGRTSVKTHPFEGVIPALERRWRETTSAAVREELAKLRSRRPCPDCAGARLRREARHVRLGARTLPEVLRLTIDEALAFFAGLALSGAHAAIAERLVREIAARLAFLADVGLGYLALDRPADTLSGGEAQRIRLASQIGSGLSGVLYVLDEPSIGLHPRDTRRLIATLARLRDAGNTVIVVEHDEETIRAADYVVDLGPGAGEQGGRVVAAGPPEAVAREPASLTGGYLSGALAIPVPAVRRRPARGHLLVRGARAHNLKRIDARFPVGLFVCVTGVSGSGKSTLVNDTLLAAAARALSGARTEPAPHDGLEGLEHYDKVVAVDQSPIGRTPRSNPATYTGIFDTIRELYAATPEARARGYGPGRFSFNVRGGRCEACQGDGVMRVPMHFLPDVYVTCDVCRGARYNRETLEVRWRGLTIRDVLELRVSDARRLFAAIPAIERRLRTLEEVGLGYLTLGRPATTLSGGEAQRVKLAEELGRRETGRTLYVLDEPTTGLHFHDVRLLLDVLLRLRDAGNTVVVVEHNLDVIKCADWILDLGPEGGEAGGRLVAEGPPEAIAADPASHTGRYLARALRAGQSRAA